MHFYLSHAIFIRNLIIVHVYDRNIKFEINRSYVNPLNAELNPICHLLALLGAHHILHVSRVKVNTDLGFVLNDIKGTTG